MSPELLARAMDIPLARAEAWAEPLALAMGAHDIVTPRRQAAFLATVGHESVGLARLEEVLSYSADRLMQVWPARFARREIAEQFERRPRELANAVYGGRMGNVQPDDGWTYRGRGPAMLTGRRNYQRAGEALCVDLTRDPDLVAQDPATGAATAAWFFKANHCIVHADSDDFDAVCDRWNLGRHTPNRYGDSIGWPDRLRRWNVARTALGLDPVDH